MQDTNKLDQMMAHANVFDKPSKPGFIRRNLRKTKSHYLAHQTYLKNIFHKMYIKMIESFNMNIVKKMFAN